MEVDGGSQDSIQVGFQNQWNASLLLLLLPFALFCLLGSRKESQG